MPWALYVLQFLNSWLHSWLEDNEIDVELEEAIDDEPVEAVDQKEEEPIRR